MTTADEWKAKGNEAFSAHNYEQAVEYFTNAIELAPENHVLYSNRSAAYASLEQFHQAFSDANKVVELKPDWPKGYSRKGVALQGLGKKKEAMECYKEGLKFDPNNEQFQSEIEQLEEEFMEENDGVAQIFGPMIQGFQHPNFNQLLALSPETSSFANDPDFLNKIEQIKKNPNLLSQYITDKRVMAALSLAMKLTKGGDVGASGASSSSSASTPTSTSTPTPTSTSTEQKNNLKSKKRHQKSKKNKKIQKKKKKEKRKRRQLLLKRKEMHCTKKRNLMRHLSHTTRQLLLTQLI